MSELFIPKKVKVGFQQRGGTYNGNLAYIIYYDTKGNLRKEQSWESWRDKKIEPIEFDNTPQDGFVLNKAVSRYGWSHFSSNRSYHRIYDPRGIEFEITPENLIGILMSDDCCKRQLQSSYVYAYSGKDLVLLPTNSEEYQKATEYTTRLAQKVSAKTLIPGCSYKTKRDGDVVYVGRFMWYEWGGKYYYKSGSRSGKKLHIFTSDNGKTFITKSSVEFLASINNEEPVSNYAAIIESFQKNIHSSKIVKFEVRGGIDYTLKPKKYYPGRYEPKNSIYFKLAGNILSQHSLVNVEKYGYNEASKPIYTQKGFYISAAGRQKINIDSQEFVKVDERSPSYSYYNSIDSYGRNAEELVRSEEHWNAMGLGNLYVTLENGREIRVDDFQSL